MVAGSVKRPLVVPLHAPSESVQPDRSGPSSSRAREAAVSAVHGGTEQAGVNGCLGSWNERGQTKPQALAIPFPSPVSMDSSVWAWPCMSAAVERSGAAAATVSTNRAAVARWQKERLRSGVI